MTISTSDLGFAFKLDEASGSRASTWVSATATEVGGTVANTTGVKDNAAVFAAANGNYLTTPHASATGLGKRDWTISLFIARTANNGAYTSYFDKPGQIRALWHDGLQRIYIEYDNGSASINFDAFATTFSGVYVSIRHDWALHKLYFRVYKPATFNYNTTVDYTWTTDDAGTAWDIGRSSGLNVGEGWIDELCMWARKLSDSEDDEKATQTSYIADFSSGPPAPSITYFGGHAWVHVGKDKTFSFLPTNTGGDVDVSGGYTSTGAALPTGVSLDADTGELTGPATSLGLVSGCQITATGDGGTDTFDFDFAVLDHKPTAQYSFVPGQRIEAATLLGICGRDPDAGDYAHAEIAFNGGAATNVTSETYDSTTGAVGWYRTFDPANYADGNVNIDGSAIAVDGQDRVLATSYVRANFNGTLTPAGKTKYCGPAGNDSTGTGTLGNPYLTPGRAASAIQDATGSCDDGTVLMLDGDYTWINGFTTACTTPNGFCEFKAANGAGVVRWTSGASGTGGLTKIKVTDIIVYQCDLTASVGVLAWFVRGGITGKGQIDDSTIGFYGSTFTGGLYITGDPVDPDSLDYGDVAAYKTAALASHFVVLNQASGPFGCQLKRNFSTTGTSKDFTFSFDVLAQNVVSHDIDATGSAFHSDFTHEFGDGGDANAFCDGAIGTECSAQPIFARNGTPGPDVPVCNYVLRNFMVRRPNATSWNGQWIRSGSNVRLEYVALPNQSMTITDDSGTPQVNHSSYWTIVKSVFKQHTFSAAMQDTTADENHFADSSVGTNCTTGGTETSWWTAPATDDFSVVAASAIIGRDITPSSPVDALGLSRVIGGEIGPFASGDAVPVISYGGSPLRLAVNFAASLTPISTGGTIPGSGAYALQTGSLPTGLTLNANTGIISGTPTVVESQTFTIRVTNTIGSFDLEETLVIAASGSGDTGSLLPASSIGRSAAGRSGLMKSSWGSR